MRTGTRCTILVKLPVAFSGGSTLNTAPVAGARLRDMAVEHLVRAARRPRSSPAVPDCMRASWLSLKLASTHRPCAGTSEMSWAPTVRVGADAGAAVADGAVDRARATRCSRD